MYQHVIDPEGLKSKGIFKQCPGNELEMWTSQGWRLVYVSYGFQPMDEERPVSRSNGGGWTVDDTRTVRRPHPGPVFLLLKDPDTVAEELRKHLSEANQLADKAEEATSILNREIDELKKILAESDTQMIKNTEYCNDLRKRYYNLNDTNKKMEEDLAKIRNAVGDLKIKEILGLNP